MSEQTTPRTVEEAAREEAERVFGWQHLVRYSGMSVEWMDRTLGAIVRNALRAQAARMPSVQRVEALCRLLVDEGHMTAEGQRQIVALWGAL